MRDTFLIVDGNSLMHRAFHALPLMDYNGQYTNALHGFLNMLLRCMKERSPRWCAVAFDEHAPTFRHTEYAEYKAGRPRTPDELRPQFDSIKEIRKNRKTMEIEEAVDKALEDMSKEYVIKPFLDAHKTEVSGMLLTEYNEAETMELFRQEGRTEGRKEGRIEGIDQNRVESIKNIMDGLKYTAQQAMDLLKIPAADQSRYMAKL